MINARAPIPSVNHGSVSKEFSLVVSHFRFFIFEHYALRVTQSFFRLPSALASPRHVNTVALNASKHAKAFALTLVARCIFTYPVIPHSLAYIGS